MVHLSMKSHLIPVLGALAFLLGSPEVLSAGLSGYKTSLSLPEATSSPYMNGKNMESQEYSWGNYSFYNCPPEGVAVEEWDAVVVNYQIEHLNGLFFVKDYDQSSDARKVKVAIDNDDFYLQDILFRNETFTPSPDCLSSHIWLKGKIKNDSVVFPKAELVFEKRVSSDSIQAFRLYPVEYIEKIEFYHEGKELKFREWLESEIRDSDWRLSFDKEKKLLKSPNYGLTYSYTGENEIHQIKLLQPYFVIDELKANCPVDAYICGFSDQAYVPTPKSVRYTPGVPSIDNENKFITVWCDCLTQEQQMINLENAYYRLYINRKQYKEDIPYWKLPMTYSFKAPEDLSLVQECYARMVLKKSDGTELEGQKVFLQDSGMDEMSTEMKNPVDDSIYDLMGRKCRYPLQPGIYVKDGKKFIVN